MLDKMTFLGEEIILKKEKITTESDPFTSSTTPNEKDSYTKFKVVKVGKKQFEYKEGDTVLVNQNGLPKEITIKGYGAITDHYSLPTANRIYCKLDE